MEKQLADKKLSRINEKISEIEEKACKFKTLYEDCQEKLDICEEELRKSHLHRERKMTAGSGNVVKTIQGGRNHGRVYSVLSNASYFIDE